jgi:hypothetical protein
MNKDKFTIALAREIRRMAKEGYEICHIQTKLKIRKRRLLEILDEHYNLINKNNILSILRLNEKGKEENVIKKEVIVIDTSFLVSSKIEDVENFLINNDNCIIPGPVIEELHNNSKDEKKNFISRRIFTILLELNTKVEISDSSIQLDPTWIKNKDYYILTVCAKLRNKGFLVKLLSFDKEMILKARGIGIDRYIIDFPQDNVKHCDSYTLEHPEKKPLPEETLIAQQEIVAEGIIVEERVSEESLEALKNKFSNSQTLSHQKVSNIKKIQPVENFEKVRSSDCIINDQTEPEILKTNGVARLVDSSCTDIFMGILKIVINSKGKPKNIHTDEKSRYSNIENLDKILVFTKQSNCSLEMKIGNIDENNKFIIEKVENLQEGCMRKINKKYHESIKEAYIKLLKIKLNKVY